MIKEEIEVPNNVNIEILENKIVVKSGNKLIERRLDNKNIIIEKKDNKVILKVYFPTRREKKDFYSAVAHIKNAITGITQGFRYKLRAVNVHFPIKLKLQQNNIIIENYLGGSDKKVIEIPKDIKVTVSENEIILEGYDIEKLGNVAGLIENSVRPGEKDLRKFQDGIYIVEKP